MTLLDTETLAHWWGLIVPSGFLLLHGLALVSSWHAVRNTRTSQAAVAWTVALLTIPLLTLPAYWVFARHRFAGYREGRAGGRASTSGLAQCH